MTINVENILCLIWSDLFNFSPQATPFVLISPGAAFGDEVEIWERYGRDMGGMKKIPPVLKPFIHRRFQRLRER